MWYEYVVCKRVKKGTMAAVAAQALRRAWAAPCRGNSSAPCVALQQQRGGMRQPRRVHDFGAAEVPTPKTLEPLYPVPETLPRAVTASNPKASTPNPEPYTLSREPLLLTCKALTRNSDAISQMLKPKL